jgi:hypothetical protein
MCGKWILAHICYAFGFALRTGCEHIKLQGSGYTSAQWLRGLKNDYDKRIGRQGMVLCAREERRAGAGASGHGLYSRRGGARRTASLMVEQQPPLNHQ